MLTIKAFNFFIYRIAFYTVELDLQPKEKKIKTIFFKNNYLNGTKR